MHDPELLIRTSGELRISNFLLWQCAYSELYFSDRSGPTSGRTTWTRRWPTTPAASAASAAAARPLPTRRRLAAGDAGGGRLVTTRIITGVVLAVLAVVVVVHGGLIFFFAHDRCSRCSASTSSTGSRRSTGRCRSPGSSASALMCSMAWFYSPFAVFGAICAGVLLRGAPRAARRPQAGRDRAHGRHRARHAVPRPRLQRRAAHAAARRGRGRRAHRGVRHLGRRHDGVLHRQVLRQHAHGAGALPQEDLGGVRRRRHQHRAARRLHRPLHAARGRPTRSSSAP